MNIAERKAFDDRASERELYKAHALANGFLFWVKPGMFALGEPIWPGKIISTEMREDCVYPPTYGYSNEEI